MRPVLPWIAAYLAILLVWALVIVQRVGPTLWKGSSLAALNIAFAAVSTATVLFERGTPVNRQAGVDWLPPGIIAFDLILIVVAAIVWKKWLLIRASHADTVTVLERCFVQTRALSVRGEDGYTVRCGEAEMTVTIEATLIGLVSVRFTGALESKKAALVRKLFGKQFHSSLPTPRIRA